LTTLHVLRVFAGGPGTGNPLGVFLDGTAVSDGERQAVARELGFSETVFVDDAERGKLRIFTPEVELPFAGHPLVGTAWLLGREFRRPSVLRPPAGEVAVRHEGEQVFITGRAEWAPEFDYVRFESAAEVDSLTGAPHGLGAVYCWAWLDEAAGLVRARSFVPEAGVGEDEATGSAALALCAQLDRPIEVRQGRGSVIMARPLGDGLHEVGGRTEHAELRDWPGGFS
jgi:predicted PhzF superfamily epimerase YddE/YHI9